jgi:hypothetical protein
MSAVILLVEAAEAGVQITLDGADLRLSGEHPPSQELLQRIRDAKSDIIAYLQAAEAEHQDEPAGDDRAAITAGIRRLAAMPPSADFPSSRWQQFIADTAAFDAAWTPQAIACAWSPVELFGLSRRSPFFWRGFGLVPMLNGAVVINIDADAITMRTRSGSMQAHRRRAPWRDAVAAWELAG